MIRIAKKTFATLGCSDNEFFEEMGYFFVEFVAQVDIVPATRAIPIDQQLRANGRLMSN